MSEEKQKLTVPKVIPAGMYAAAEGIAERMKGFMGPTAVSTPNGAKSAFVVVNPLGAFVVSVRPLGSERTDDPEFNHWGEDPAYPVRDWRYQAGNNDTRLGYWDWVDGEREADAADEEGEDDGGEADDS